MRAAALTRRDAADHARAVSDCLLGMERALSAGEALANDAGVFIDEDGHGLSGLRAASGRFSDFGNDLLRRIVEVVGRNDGKA